MCVQNEQLDPSRRGGDTSSCFRSAPKGAILLPAVTCKEQAWGIGSRVWCPGLQRKSPLGAELGGSHSAFCPPTALAASLQE